MASQKGAQKLSKRVAKLIKEMTVKGKKGDNFLGGKISWVRIEEKFQRLHVYFYGMGAQNERSCLGRERVLLHP